MLNVRFYCSKGISDLIVSIIIISIGMHRKSLEAAEALKDDSGCSDRDDEHSKASDNSSTGNPSTKSTPNSKTKKSYGCSESMAASPPTPATSMNSDNAVNHNSVTSSPASTPSANTHTPLPVHHLIESKSMLASPTHSTFHHDNDTDAFRWDISFIRCDNI